MNRPVALVSMPTLSARFPSFQLGLLQPTLAREGIATEPFSLFLFFGRFAGWPLAEALSEVYPSMVGEWIWSKAAFGHRSSAKEYFAEYRDDLAGLCDRAGCTMADLERLRDQVAFDFLDWAVESTDWSRFSLVGMTIVFQQMVASLAMAKWLKKKHPKVPIVLGGATFEDDIANEIFARNPQVDFVHQGDGDLSFPEMVKRLHAGKSMRGLAGVLWRDGGKVVDNGRAPNLEDLNRTPVPNYDEYFASRAVSGYDAFDGAQPVMVPIETARGCWYGMKNHCTFCGLNRSGMDFRSKSPEQVLDLLKELSRKYGTLRFNAIDNIVAPEYAEKLFAKLAEGKTDLKLHYEIRPNINRQQLKMMHEGGLTSVQPGVEHFSTHVLTLMKKFTTGVRNLELIKWTTYYGIDNYYNLLTGFAGETVEDYKLTADLIRKIFHLAPPYAFAQARPDRGSPMFEKPDEHQVTRLTPSRCYRHIYPADWDLRRAAYFFEHEVQNVATDEELEQCRALVYAWQEAWKGPKKPYLVYRKAWETIAIEDGRFGEPYRWQFRDREAALYELCIDAKRKDDIVAHFKDDAHWVDAALEGFVEKNLMVHLDGKYLALALPENQFV
jgi:ribosomal peptide maturation radical SAM protein 1